MALGDLFKKVAEKGLEKGVKLAKEKGLFGETQHPQQTTVENAKTIELKKAEELEKILKPTCEKGDCLWNSHCFYFTCGDNVDCQRKNVTKKDWGEPLTHPEIWPYMKRLEILQKNNGPEDQEKEFILDLIKAHMPNFDNLKGVLRHNIMVRGFVNNTFFDLVWDVKDFEIEDLDQKLYVLSYGNIDGVLLNLENDFYRNPSLYQRNKDDFEYTVKTFERTLDREELATYYKDISNISIKQFYDADANILPAGIGGPEAGFYDTSIWNVVESWSGENEF